MKKQCTNAGCSLKGMQVDTDAKNCIGCDRPMQSDLAASLDQALADATDDILKKFKNL